MSLLEVARIAGVSASTVHRVLHDCQRVAPKTAETVRRTIHEINFVPRRYHRNGRIDRSKIRDVALIFFDAVGDTAPALQQLVKGVSQAARAHDVRFSVAFWNSSDDLSQMELNRHFDGVLLHGRLPSPEICRRLTCVPSVWLMANHPRPAWGDHVLPDDFRIGELAARYLLDRRHEHLAYLGPRLQDRASDLRGLAFCALAEAHGFVVHRLLGLEERSDRLRSESVTAYARAIVRELKNGRPRPTGLFIAEDRLLPALTDEFASAGISLGRDKDLDVVSCNSESAYLGQPGAQLPIIDIRAEAVAYQGMEQLCRRMRNPGTTERIRVSVEPCLTIMAERG